MPISGKPEIGGRGRKAPHIGRPRPSRRTRCASAPQRLCSFSSGVPLFFVPEHGVEDGEDFASDRDEGNHFWLTAREQALVEDAHHWVPPAGGERDHEDGCANVRPAACDHAFALPSAGLAREWGIADQAGNLASREAAEFGEVCQYAT